MYCYHLTFRWIGLKPRRFKYSVAANIENIFYLIIGIGSNSYLGQHAYPALYVWHRKFWVGILHFRAEKLRVVQW